MMNISITQLSSIAIFFSCITLQSMLAPACMWTIIMTNPSFMDKNYSIGQYVIDVTDSDATAYFFHWTAQINHRAVVITLISVSVALLRLNYWASLYAEEKKSILSCDLNFGYVFSYQVVRQSFNMHWNMRYRTGTLKMLSSTTELLYWDLIFVHRFYTSL